jgi:hypothetical protein
MVRLAIGVVLAVLASQAAGSEPLKLQGTWHVIAHYKDSTTNNPDAERWEDRVWVFKREGDRLRWVDYPIVVLADERGRFQARRRVLAYWTPSPSQADELAAGPTVNTRGSKSKSLRGSDATGWKSSSTQARSMAFITYEELWSIQAPGEKPVFERRDMLGSAGTESAEGRTLWATGSVVDPDVLEGSYDRDGIRTGSFRMTRVGDVKFLSTDGPTPNEKAAEAAREELLRQEQGGGAP